MRHRIIDSILAATDLTEGGDVVLRAAGRLARALCAELHVVHALEFPFADFPGLRGSAAAFRNRAGEAVELLDEQIARTLPPGIVAASRQVVIRRASRAIFERAREVSADLVVLGPHRRRGRTGGFLGTTADRVIRSSDAPCLVVRDDLSLPLRRVMVPLDLSEPSRGGLDLALAWTEALGTRDPESGLPGTELQVVHVVPPGSFPDDLRLDRAVIGPCLYDEVEAAIARSEHGATVTVREEVLWGDEPAEEILRYADEQRADLLVLATHGHGALRRALVGSIASAVARGAGCPVLLVPPSLWKGDGEEPDGESAGDAAAAGVA
ncbi:MAG: universal stress protein [Longimicrobiaceae bacterium]